MSDEINLDPDAHWIMQPSDWGDFTTPDGGCVTCGIFPPGVCRLQTLVEDAAAAMYLAYLAAMPNPGVFGVVSWEGAPEATKEGWRDWVRAKAKDPLSAATPAKERAAIDQVVNGILDSALSNYLSPEETEGLSKRIRDAIMASAAWHSRPAMGDQIEPLAEAEREALLRHIQAVESWGVPETTGDAEILDRVLEAARREANRA